MISIRYTTAEAAALRDRILLVLDAPDTAEGRAAAGQLRALATELATATASMPAPPAPVDPYDQPNLN